MTTLAHSAPKINWDDLTQSPALPLGSWLKTDPWDDHVHQLNAKVYAPLNPRDKMPLEVTPVYFRLQRYDEAQAQAANAAGAAKPERRRGITARGGRSASPCSSATDHGRNTASGRDRPAGAFTGPDGTAATDRVGTAARIRSSRIRLTRLRPDSDSRYPFWAFILECRFRVAWSIDLCRRMDDSLPMRRIAVFLFVCFLCAAASLHAQVAPIGISRPDRR